MADVIEREEFEEFIEEINLKLRGLEICFNAEFSNRLHYLRNKDGDLCSAHYKFEKKNGE